ncbi:hypothetical protein ACZ11_06450 [Lysinibacillus xylanilyticus]|uniref:Uncharacterized protein n=1 Tax=Lysinibacillus xylanilyticus TaxID=582475 RepID=A0A0K9FBH5_9BACI|nr:hypothetical protein ACZ11_06450 [Lysinibacillus xylanilyticus]
MDSTPFFVSQRLAVLCFFCEVGDKLKLGDKFRKLGDKFRKLVDKFRKLVDKLKKLGDKLKKLSNKLKFRRQITELFR